MDLQSLKELHAAVKAGTVGDWRLYTRALGLLPDDRHILATRAYDGDLNAARALHDALLPDVAVSLETWPGAKCLCRLTGTHAGAGGDRWHGKDDLKASADDDDLSRAWLLAQIECLIAREERAR